ncbi:transcriptional regulator [Paenibacillus riograndensis]|uniref:Transcriptional regulator n=1 Tax=Paenibacillus riograndensis TaxID=483937 RepID=A0A132UA49_9BACL|nr:GyrI-like domain-containing protein [Paenibacillus riograndensis]KWX80408.1 transcriptional regulator [Paenibacillus riograndensis]KWX83744.1 transcriptional regulator [Paenibacillus riograndensis]
MNTYTVHKQKLIITGVAVRTTNAEEAGPEGRLPKLWETYFQSNLLSAAGGENPHFIYAVYTDYESDANGAYTVVIGHESSAERVPDDKNHVVVAVPGSKYRVFTTKKGPVYEVVAQAWREIWAYFGESTEKRAYTGDFELYDARDFDPANTELQIYIAIK